MMNVVPVLWGRFVRPGLSADTIRKRLHARMWALSVEKLRDYCEALAIETNEHLVTKAKGFEPTTFEIRRAENAQAVLDIAVNVLSNRMSESDHDALMVRLEVVAQRAIDDAGRRN